MGDIMNIDKIYKPIIISAVLMMAAVMMIQAYGGTDPTTMGHSSGELVGVVPTGAVMAFDLTTCPSGWKPADGTDGTDDLRGMFLRGLNTFDAGSTTRSDGKQDPSSRILGAYQADKFDAHTHEIKNRAIYQSGGAAEGMAQNGAYGSGVTKSAGGDETRPRNVAYIYCVKE